MTPLRRTQALSVLLLLAAVAAFAFGLWSQWRVPDFQGPVTLGSSAEGELWVGVDERLWRLGADGTLRHDEPVAALGLPGAPATLTRHPQGGMLASVRHDPTLYRLDAGSARVVGRVFPQWPADLAVHGSRAINVAQHADGRVAIATGGGHAVALFGPDGRFLARTVPGSYRFTNGLWWQGDSLWTTDTNRTQLKRLDGRTLALQQTVPLDAGEEARFLGPAREHPTSPERVALIRFRNGMTVGRLTLVEGLPPLERALPDAGHLEPNDVDWVGDAIVVTDSHRQSLLQHRPGVDAGWQPFGDARVQRLLAEGRARRDAARNQGRLALAAAAVLMALAIVAAAAAQRRGTLVLANRRPLDLSALGTPRLPWRAWLPLAARVGGPWMLPWTVVVSVRFVVPWVREAVHRPWAPAAAVALLWVPLLALLWWAHRGHLRRAQDPRFEPVFNAYALRRLGSEAALREALAADERVQETFVWVRWRPHWVVLTTARLLVFTRGMRGWRLAEALTRADLTDVECARRGPRGRLHWALPGRRQPGWLAMRTPQQDWIGRVTAPTVAARVATALGGRVHGGALR